MKSLRFPLHDIQEIFRGRYRCPRCRSIGTWNPHGGLWDQFYQRGQPQRKVRRWMCKWCGLYRGPEGWQEVLCDPNVGCWQLVKDAGPNSFTPQQVMTGSPIPKCWPWRY